MSAFLVSDTKHVNPSLEQKLRSELAKHGNTVAYISSAPQNEEKTFFRCVEADYHRLVPDARLEYFELSAKFSDQRLERILDSERYIYLGETHTASWSR